MTIPEHLVADFIEWSGGFHPSECTPEEIFIYMTYVAPKDGDNG